jgi:hypothetical protein
MVGLNREVKGSGSWIGSYSWHGSSGSHLVECLTLQCLAMLRHSHTPSACQLFPISRGTGVRHQKTTYAVHSDFQSFPTCRFKRRSTSLIRSFSPGFAITRRPSTRSCALIAVVLEDCAPFITASCDVIDRPCVFQSQTPCHVRTLLYHAAHRNAFFILLMPDPYSATNMGITVFMSDDLERRCSPCGASAATVQLHVGIFSILCQSDSPSWTGESSAFARSV